MLWSVNLTISFKCQNFRICTYYYRCSNLKQHVSQIGDPDMKLFQELIYISIPYLTQSFAVGIGFPTLPNFAETSDGQILNHWCTQAAPVDWLSLWRVS